MNNKKSKICKWTIRISLFLFIILVLFSVLYFTGNSKKKWIVILLFLSLIFVFFLVLYFTGNLKPFLRKTKNKFTVLSIAFYIVVFLSNLITGWITTYTYNFIFTSEIETNENDETSKQIFETSKQILENTNIDPRIIKNYLDKLSSLSTIELKKNQIKQWYDNFDIDTKLKDILIIIIKHKEETIWALEKKIKAENNSAYATALKNLKSSFKIGDAQQIKDNYFRFTKQQNKENIEMLKISIDASKQLFAFDKTIALYEELLKREPSAENYFIIGLYLQKLNYFDRALEKYEEALKIYRVLAKKKPRTYLPDVAITLNNLANLHLDKNEFPLALEKYKEALKIRRVLAKEDPRTYLPDVAMTLNNLANLQKAKNEFPQALKKYEEALKIRRALAKENPRTYLPDVAMILNNLANLQKAKNEFPLALKKYEKALKIYRVLAKENPRTYLPYVAMTLNNLAVLHSVKNEFPQAMENYQEALKIIRTLAEENPRVYEIKYAKSILTGVLLLGENKKNLQEAKRILLKYKGIPEADKFLEVIKQIEENE